MFFHWRAQGIDLQERKIAQLTEKINYLFQARNFKGIKSCIKNNPIPLLVDVLEKFENIDVIIISLITAKKIKLGQLFLAFSPDTKLKILEHIPTSVLNDLLEDLNSDDVVQILQDVPKDIYKKIVVNCSAELKEEIKKIRRFKHTQIGSIMNTTILTLQSSMTISRAIRYIRKMKNQFDIEDEIYVVDQEKRISGKIKTQDLLFTEKSQTIISEIVDKSYVTAYASDDIDNIIDLFKKFNLSTVAIINQEKQMLGIINHSDIIPEILSENVENVYKLYGIRDAAESYLNTSVLDIVKSRIFWLLMMLFAATFTTLAIDKFESLGIRWTAGVSSAILVPIIPIITDMCGNTGSQTTATVIQAIATGELKSDHFKKVLVKELKISTIIGSVLAVFNFLRLVIYFAIVPLDKTKFHFNAGVVLASLSLTSDGGAQCNIDNIKLFHISLIGGLASSFALFLVVVLSKLFGVIIPFISVRLDYDPAAFSTPVLTTILDTLASMIFFLIGTTLIYLTINPILGMTVSGGKLSASNSYSCTSLSQVSELLTFGKYLFF